MKVLFTSKVALTFAEFVFNKIISEFGWTKLESYLSEGVNPVNEKSLKIRSLDIKLTNLFYVSESPATLAELSKGGSNRYNLNPIFESDNLYCYFGSEWGYNSSKLNLDLLKLQKFVNSEFGNIFNIELNESPKSFTFIENQNKDFPKIGRNNIYHSILSANNKIYFGCPGTGKSYKMEKDTEGSKSYETTFHPEYDYAAFVGSYKPIMKDEKIHYAFTPQVFTKACVEAYKKPDKNIVLKIEEINRGNCAMIFGDIFQLLDRHPSGESKYEITPDADLAAYLKEELGDKFTGKLKLPRNLSIYATMNTSDQSLFPMDSAFKRRWEWEYVPIDLEKADTMIFVANGKNYNWADFLKKVNKRIYDITESEDKQIGTFFVSGEPLIEPEQFKTKVMFYLWYDVFKNEIESEHNIFKDKDGEKITFTDLFHKEKGDTNLETILTKLGLEAIPTSIKEVITAEQVN